MGIILPLFSGFLISLIGVILPGLVNMTAVKISMKDGSTRAVVFSLGATAVVFFQTYIALTFAKFIYNRPDVADILHEIGLGIFVVLTIYFLFFAKTAKQDVEKEVNQTNSKTGRFFLGMLFSALNFFPIPYYVFLSVALSSYDYFYFTPLFVFLFVIGVMAGSFSAFCLYIMFFRKIQHKAGFLIKNINYLIGGITGLISVITAIKLLRGF